MADKPKKLTRAEIDAMSHEERRRWVEEKMNETASQKINDVLAYIKVNPQCGKLFCEKILEAFNSDDAGGFPELLLRLQDSRKGKSRGSRKTWTKQRYLNILIRYELLVKLIGREETQRVIGESEGIGVNGKDGFNPKKVEERITEARKIILEDELNKYLPDYMNIKKL
ncbi:hypothetical protein [Nitrosomonas sp. Nm34]|uniref:hypothetical protein n=1 Tax=Nitrosomonas sp. Nm34 TaxID=1881055 RepID=UPI0008ED951C|nr:hypothetical protein [Nitrosomonas sp. Nm34]SFI70767.1 hypothetical protein SAMN05428978_102827 [Nitrosomonas sp. Nm34]